MMQSMAMQHIKEMLVAKGKTQSELAAALGRDKSAITNLLQGKRQLKAQEIPLIAAFLEINEAQVLGIEPADSGLQEAPRIRFQGAPSAAILQKGHVIEEDGTFYLEDNASHDDRCYALEVKDHSLDLSGILAGDLVICDPSKSPADQDIVVVQVYAEDGSANTVLRQYRSPFLDAHSSQKGFDRLHEERANVAILCPVIQLIRLY